MNVPKLCGPKVDESAFHVTQREAVHVLEDFKTLFRMLELAQRSIELRHGLHQWAVLWEMCCLTREVSVP